MMNVTQARDQRGWLRVASRRVLVLRLSVYGEQQECASKQKALHTDLAFSYTEFLGIPDRAPSRPP
jgi:hypothetical protein